MPYCHTYAYQSKLKEKHSICRSSDSDERKRQRCHGPAPANHLRYILIFRFFSLRPPLPTISATYSFSDFSILGLYYTTLHYTPSSRRGQSGLTDWTSKSRPTAPNQSLFFLQGLGTSPNILCLSSTLLHGPPRSVRRGERVREIVRFNCIGVVEVHALEGRRVPV